MTVRTAIACLVLLVVASNAEAQDSAGAASEGRSGFLEQLRDVFEDESRKWRPVAAIIAPGAGIGGGGTIQIPVSDARPYGASLEGLLSIYNFQQLTLRAGRLNHRGDLSSLRPADSSATAAIDAGELRARGWSLYLEHRYRRLPRVRFFGLDSERQVVQTDFGVRRHSTDVVLQWKPLYRFGIGARVGSLLTTRFPGTDGRRPNTEDQFGDALDADRPTAVRYLTAGLAAVIDRRSTSPSPRAGWLVQGAVTAFRTGEEAWASFTRLTIDATGYQPLISRRHVLAARAIASTDRRTGVGPVPYFLQQSLGGASSLRSYSSHRFRGDSLTYLSLESRWNVHRYLQLVPFIDTGRVWRPPLPQGGRATVSSAGVGARFRYEERTAGRLELAYGREGVRIVVAVDSPF